MARILFVPAAYLLVVNLLVFCAFGRDKRLALQGRYRVPEARLLLYAALGGALGAWLGMKRFHHKTRKWRFRLLVPLFFLLHLALAALLVWLLH